MPKLNCKRALFLFGLIIFLAGIEVKASMCGYMTQFEEEWANNADLAFEGTVINIEEQEYGPEYFAEFKITKLIKGTADSPIKILAHKAKFKTKNGGLVHSSPARAVPFEVGKHYRVYTSKKKDELYYSTGLNECGSVIELK